MRSALFPVHATIYSDPGLSRLIFLSLTRIMFLRNLRHLLPSQEIDVEDKDALFDAVYAGVTQKGASQVQGFKMKKAKTLAASTESTYVTFEYSYTLLTGAGFEIDRKGIGSIVSVKGSRSTQMMLGACTDIRLKKVEGDLREVADSFRVYSGVIPPS